MSNTISPDDRARHTAIRAFYAANLRALLARLDEWGVDPYAWDHVLGIRLTAIEFALWSDIRDANLVMYPQYPVGPFFVDFGNPAAKVAIECDGRAYHLDKAKDAERQRLIEARGWAVYRITGRDCFSQMEVSVDDFGNDVCTISAAQRFVRAIGRRHPVKRLTASRGMVPIGQALGEAFDSIIASARQSA